ncbi:hypothetical protein ABL78_8417 [Leptomonas seymouri]|uniref:Uncharacterized protein n=1 Tax=Leptomonas seymouri TaxID=5684 RepID=A0A0N1HSQ4_LEPSE|nr:hypothetical protein ABL78_8417 [Leptomonas seymouri]|eukprot:KPI82574.1 hypothetical protein ABL78_8417 [Leptomonas seymouri]
MASPWQSGSPFLNTPVPSLPASPSPSYTGAMHVDSSNSSSLFSCPWHSTGSQRVTVFTLRVFGFAIALCCWQAT